MSLLDLLCFFFSISVVFFHASSFKSPRNKPFPPTNGRTGRRRPLSFSPSLDWLCGLRVSVCGLTPFITFANGVDGHINLTGSIWDGRLRPCFFLEVKLKGHNLPFYLCCETKCFSFLFVLNLCWISFFLSAPFRASVHPLQIRIIFGSFFV